eukprot:s2903_g5.t1
MMLAPPPTLTALAPPGVVPQAQTGAASRDAGGPDLDLDVLYVLGTNCVDNPRDAEALQRFLRSASETPETAVGFEFMQDNRIHIKHRDGRYERIPVFSLEEPHTCTGVIAKSCYACFDYVNALTDLTVGYMATPWEGENWGS